jgi:prevent-host-death family protein
MTASEVRGDFGETVNRVAYGNEVVVVERRGKPLAALISYTDYQLLQQLVSKLEEQMDADDLAARSREKTLNFAQVVAGLSRDGRIPD